MRPPRAVVSIAAGLILGASAAGAGLWVGSRDAAADPVVVDDAPPPATVPKDDERPVWADPGEIVLGPTVLVPRGASLDGGELILAYDLVDIAPPATGFPGPNASEAAAAPELWTLLTTSGERIEARTTAAARSARFPVPDGFDPTTVTGARIDAWRVRLPVTHILEIAHDDLSDHVLEPSTAVGLRLILAQAQNTLVQFRVSHPQDGFSGGSTTFSLAFEAQPGVRGVGPGWTNVGITETGTQLTYVGGELPDPFTIAVDTHEYWVVTDPLEVAFEVGGDG